MDHLKKGYLVDLANEDWRERGYGGFPCYSGDVELWRAPSAAWNVADEEGRRILVSLGHIGSIRMSSYALAFNDTLNCQILGILGDVEPDFTVTLDEAIERAERNAGN